MCVCVFEADWETELHECGFDCQEVNVVARETRLSAVSQIPLCVCVCVCATSSESSITMRQEITVKIKNSPSLSLPIQNTHK